ncbi:MAG: S49 family peptidase [Rhodospirillum sp.]|nr:S49 family peptidase [Rhodospirillum sp.]MCF8489791.1 S49 family peptidase [Rhodospirillum sp.]MCF8500503.1 S49 family peptidase [Rhodospirillum sp.]
MRFIGKAFLFLFAFLGILASLLIVLLLVLASSLTSETDMVEGTRSVLTLDINGPFPEQATVQNPLTAVLNGASTPPLRTVTESLAAAAVDPEIRGLIAHVGSAQGLGMAQAQELRDAILAFKASGKPTVAYSESIGEFSGGTIPYYVASVFDRVWLQPSGMVASTGFSAEVPFLRGLLDDLGILPEVFTRENYKDAMASVTDTGMSSYQRISLGAVLNGWSDQVITAVARDRGLSQGEVRGLINRAPLLAQEALEAKLVDQLGYPDEVEKAVTESTGEEQRLSLTAYATKLANRDTDPDARRIALISARGPVILGDGASSPFDQEEIDCRALANAIDEAANDPDLAAIVLRIDSPGGSYVGSDLVWRSIRNARETGIPVIASMGNAAASGGYFIAMGADRIIAQPGTLTGSIGVLAGKVSIAQASADLNVGWDRVTRGGNADMFSPVTPFDDQGRARMNAIMDAIYADFTGKAAEARNLSAEAIEQAAQGRVWLGADAVEKGLVDELGGLSLAFARAREQVGLDPNTPLDVVVFPRDDTPEWMKGLIGAAKGLEGVSSALGLASTLNGFLGPELTAIRAMNAGPISSPVAIYAQ